MEHWRNTEWEQGQGPGQVPSASAAYLRNVE